VTRFMLDTNIVGHFLKEHPSVVRRVVAASMTSLSVSAITAGELLFGLAKRPDATKLHLAVREFLRRVDVLPWDHAAATRYATVRAELQNDGKTLAPLDMLIATHALHADAVMVTNDGAFRHVPNLRIEDWTG
jgi:tRNA(fMet)-specific endonuclease VapC